MDKDEARLNHYIIDNKIKAEHVFLGESCHSVEQAAKAVSAKADDFVKNICMVDDNGNLIVAIVKGEDRASTKRVGRALNISAPRIALLDEVLQKTGYPSGGVPSFGYEAIFLIDPRVMEKEIIYTGGGSEYSLLRIQTEILQSANNGQIIRVRK